MVTTLVLETSAPLTLAEYQQLLFLAVETLRNTPLNVSGNAVSVIADSVVARNTTTSQEGEPTRDRPSVHSSSCLRAVSSLLAHSCLMTCVLLQ